MSVFVKTAGRSARRLLWPTVVAVAFAWFATRDDSITGAVDGGTVAFTWIHVAAIWLGGCGLLTLLDEWPMFDRDRAERRWLARIARGPWQGCVAAGAGMTLALAGSLAVTGVAFAWLLPENARAVRDHTPASSAPIRLAHSQESVSIPIDDDRELGAIELRAFVHHRDGANIAATELDVFADGVSLTERPLLSVALSDLHRVEFTPRTIERLEIRRAPNAAPVAVTIPPGALQLVSARTRSHALNAVLACLTYLLPTAFAITLACLLRGLVGSATSWFGTLATFLGTSALGIAPNIEAVDACVDARWILTESTTAHGWAAAGTCLAVLVIAIPRPRGQA